MKKGLKNITTFRLSIIFWFCIMTLGIFTQIAYADKIGIPTAFYDPSQAKKQLIRVKIPENIVVQDGTWLKNEIDDSVQILASSDSYANFMFRVRKCANQSCSSVDGVPDYVYSVTTTESTYINSSHSWMGSVFNMRCTPFSISELALVVEGPGTYAIYTFIPRTAVNYLQGRYYERIFVTISNIPDSQEQNGTCGKNVSYAIEGDTIVFKKTDSNSDAIWYEDCGKVFKNDTSIKKVRVDDKIFVLESSGKFQNFRYVQEMYLSKLDVSNITGSVREDDVGWQEINGMYGMFANCYALKTLDLSGWDVSNVINMASMFEDCSSLTNLYISNWDTSNVKDMSAMFVGCKSLSSLDINKWNVTNVRDMYAMFAGCYALKTLDLSNWDVSNVIRMKNMFHSCRSMNSLNLDNWDASNVKYMTQMFYGCNSLISLDLSSWDTSNVTDYDGQTYADYMFYDCTSLNTLTLGKNTLNKNIFETLPQYNDAWTYVAQGTVASNPIKLGSVRKNASLFTDYDYMTMAGTWTRSTIEDTVNVMITGFYDFFAYDGEEHSVRGYDVVIDHPLYSESDFEFTGTAEVKRMAVGISYMGLKESDFFNKSDQFQNVTFHVTDGYVEITDGADNEETAILEHVNQDGSKGAPDDLEVKTFDLTVTIKGNKRNWTSREISLNTSDLLGKNKTDLPLVFPGSLPRLNGEYEVLINGLPKYLYGIEGIYGADEMPMHKYYLSYKAWINSERKIEIVLFWRDERYQEKPEDEIAVYALPEDEIGAYAEGPDGVRQYLIFQTYDICMNYLGSEELCSGNTRCYHK